MTEAVPLVGGMYLAKCDICKCEAYCELCESYDPQYNTYDYWYECERCLVEECGGDAEYD